MFILLASALIFSSGVHSLVVSEQVYSTAGAHDEPSQLLAVDIHLPEGGTRTETIAVTSGELTRFQTLLASDLTMEEKVTVLAREGFIPPSMAEEMNRTLSLIQQIHRTSSQRENMRIADTTLSFHVGCLLIADGYGRAFTRITTFFKAFLNQIFGHIFGIMPPFFTVIPELDILVSRDGGLLLLDILGTNLTMSPLYLLALFGFVGLHWRLLTEPIHFFMGGAAAVCAAGVAQEPYGKL